MTDEELIKEIEAQRSLMDAVATGGPKIQGVNQQYVERRERIQQELGSRNLNDPNPHCDLWAWYGRWSAGDLFSWASRRAHLSEMYQPLIDLIRGSVVGARVFEEPTGWDRVDRGSNQTKNVKPEVVAAAIFVAMLNKGDIQTILNNFTTMNNQNVELELKFLKVFCKVYALLTTVIDTNLRQAILKAFYSFFFSKSEDYFGCQFELVSEKLDVRIKRYSEALDEPSQHGPAYNIGKQFSKFIGYEDSAISTYQGALFFTTDIKFTGSALENILK